MSIELPAKNKTRFVDWSIKKPSSNDEKIFPEKDVTTWRNNEFSIPSRLAY